jgi:hypothetical protein
MTLQLITVFVNKDEQYNISQKQVFFHPTQWNNWI